ncbi:hypothetical protein P4603_26200 [Priestia aryabhattai]|uniref:hypothetical protein n=1 Tax=Priestia aryabhattai TaxID=412384 RepID=UPI002E1D7239|nr:hypothetical protein [Priestia aryabhattai]
MREKKFSKVVLEFIKDEVVECELDNDNDVLILVKDVNADAVSPERINEHLSSYGYTARFEYGDGDWMSIIKKEK